MRHLLLLVCPLITSFAACATDWYVQAGQSLQTTLNEALPGDTITLQAGATFTGNFVLPNKSGTSWIQIRSSMMSSLPARGERVNPSYAPFMAKIVTPNGTPALSTATGAHHYWIKGLELTVASGVYTFNVVQLGTGKETSIADLPSFIALDRLYIHGDPLVGGKRGITLNSQSTSVKNSYISDIKSTTQDSQAICGWNGPGPFHIINNYLEASGENIMFGGSPTSIPDMVPSNIVIQKNHLFKPLSWKVGDPTYAGTKWIVKNNFELKNARHVTFDSNVVENCWAQGQSGIPIMFTVRTEHGLMPWAVVENVTFTNNIVRNVLGGISLLGIDVNNSGVGRNFIIQNNLFDNVNGRFIGTTAIENLTVDHNTAFQTTFVLEFDVLPNTGLVYQNNISPHGKGIFGSGSSEGIRSLAEYAPGSIVRRNVIAGANAAIYPLDNYFPASIYDVDFVDMSAGNYALAPTSPYIGLGTDGKDLGVDFAALQLATAGVVQ